MTKVCDNTSVGMLVYKNKKILLIERKKYPFGFAIPAGHVDNKGSFENAAREELEEEVGLKIKNLKLIKEGRKENPCRREGGFWHYWKIYKVEAEGKLKPSENETKQAGWYTKKQIEKLTKRTKQYLAGKISEDNWGTSPGLEPVWYEWFKELKIEI
ncbi:NUDIX domain-containing protein [Patescibacteria group bacterium]|nr:NUDIX domain-containing protein [Patescibacteria group bacterium]